MLDKTTINYGLGFYLLLQKQNGIKFSLLSKAINLNTRYQNSFCIGLLNTQTQDIKIQPEKFVQHVMVSAIGCSSRKGKLHFVN